MKNILSWIKARLSEKTTWAIIITFAGTVTGRTIAPELADSITTIGLALASIIGAASSEQPK